MKIISVGEILWDVFEQGEYLGGAPFNFATHARRLGHDVYFVSAVGDDERGRAALSKVQELGLATRFIQQLEGQPTGIVSVSLDPLGKPCFVIHRPAAYDFVSLSDGDLVELSLPEADWIYFGTLHQVSPGARALFSALVRSNPHARRFYDINLRPESYDTDLVRDLMQRSSVVKLNDEEVRAVEEMFGTGHRSIELFCRDYAKAYRWDAVCVTRGDQGCSILVGDEFGEMGGYAVPVADTVGAGDAFAAAFLHGLSNGWSLAEIGDFANRVGALVASRNGGIPAWSIAEARALLR